jgi:hypothetical protein
MENYIKKDTSLESSAVPPKKKPYQKPSFQFERAFETMALACGKIGSTSESCSTVSSLS